MQRSDKIRVAVVGASGYTGGELLRLLAGHPRSDVVAVTSEKSIGATLPRIFPSLASVLPALVLEPADIDALAKRVDVFFLALPHTKSLEPVAKAIAAGRRVVDLSADYRLRSVEDYERWYDVTHPYPDLLAEAVYGLPELYRDRIRPARLVASPGCYPTAAILQLAPLVSHGLIQRDTVVIDAKSGVSGAGRSPSLPYHFPEAHESLEPYKIGRHRHIPEIEHVLGQLLPRSADQANVAAEAALRVTFTPHLIPMNRGILSTAYCRVRQPMELSALRQLYRDFYAGEHFIRFHDGETVPNPRYLRGANFCDLGIYTDDRAGWIVTVAALDNLIKGAAGQAVQAMNLMLGCPEEMGLTAGGVFP